MDWRSNAAEDNLKAWVDLGVPYPDIAERLGTTVGAVCGKVHRLKIGRGPKKPDRLWARGGRGPDTTPNIAYLKILKRQEQEAVDRAGLTVALESAEDHHCKYVIGDPVQRRLCGAPRVDGTPYCQEHGQLCTSIVTVETRRAISATHLASPRAGRHAFYGVPREPMKPAMRMIDPRTLEEADDATPEAAANAA